MTFLNPLAFLGLAALLVPAVLHLLTQHRARVYQFPSLRFVPATTPVPSWSAKPGDLLLLAVRLLILLAAVLALAGPVPLADPPLRVQGNQVLAIVLDTTSMSATQADSVRNAVAPLVDSAHASRFMVTSDVNATLPAAQEWLMEQEGGEKEIVVISRLLRKSGIGATAAAAIPADIGIRLIRLPAARAADGDAARAVAVTGAIPVRIDAEVAGDSTLAFYRTVASVGDSVSMPQLFAESPEELRALGSVMASLPHWARSATSAENIRVHYAGSPEWETLRTQADAALSQSGARQLLKLQRSSALAEAARSSRPTVSDSGARSSALITVAVNDLGQPVVDAAAADKDGVGSLHLFVNSPPLSAVSVALLAAIREIDLELPARASDTATMTESEVAAIQREAVPVPSHAGADMTWIRSLWLLALLLLGVETLLRRRRRVQ